MARRGEMFAGPELLEAMVSQGLRYGDMDIFHRHESEDGRGQILFSAANMVVPGTFDLSAMEDFFTPGISMFLSLPIASDSLAAYNLMANTAQHIAEVLGGELKDENRSVMTRQTIEHGRQRVIEYERKRRLAKS
jgi:cell division protein ZipA